MNNRYSTKGLTDAEFEPGSNKQVLKNLLGIKSRRTIDQQEAESLFNTEKWAFGYFSRNHRFTAADVKKIHKVFLGRIYAWAGSYRNVNLTKGGFPFAPAREIHPLMAEFSDNILSRYTPCIFKDKEKVIDAIGIVHSELLLIHPFREGNGRLARLLADLMALQAGLPALDWFIKDGLKQSYYQAIQSGLSKDYEPIKAVIRKALQRALRRGPE